VSGGREFNDNTSKEDERTNEFDNTSKEDERMNEFKINSSYLIITMYYTAQVGAQSKQRRENECLNGKKERVSNRMK
jgi:hypothetical protein